MGEGEADSGVLVLTSPDACLGHARSPHRRHVRIGQQPHEGVVGALLSLDHALTIAPA